MSSSPRQRGCEHPISSLSRALIVGLEGKRETALTSIEIASLPNARHDAQALSARIADEPLAVFLDYHGALTRIVDDVPSSEQDAPKVTPGKMAYELQSQIDCDKGKAVRDPLEALELDTADVVRSYVADDITDQHAFQALSGTGIGVLVANPAGPETAGRTTAAEYSLPDVHEVPTLLDGLARSGV